MRNTINDLKLNCKFIQRLIVNDQQPHRNLKSNNLMNFMDIFYLFANKKIFVNLFFVYLFSLLGMHIKKLLML